MLNQFMKTKFEIEYSLNTSPRVLYSRLSTAGGLSEWFANDVYVNGKMYTFVWDGTEQIAEMILKKENHFTRFHWIDDEDPKAYFEFRIHIEELTNDVALLITDFAEEEDVTDAQELWNTQIGNLRHILGL